MNFINVGGNNTGSILPMTCICSTGSGQVAARGNDSCFHCGCSCKYGSKTNAGNSSRARVTINKPGFYEPE